MAKVKMFRARAGMSLEVGGTWYRFECAVEIEVEDGDDVSDIKRKAWNTVESELEKKVQETLA